MDKDTVPHKNVELHLLSLVQYFAMLCTALVVECHNSEVFVVVFFQLTIMKGGPKHLKCTEDEDFMTAFDKMMSENIQVVFQ